MKSPGMIELTQEEIDGLLERTKKTSEPDDYELIKSLIDSLHQLKIAHETKSTSVKRLLKMLFGPGSEKKKKIIRKDRKQKDEATGCDPESDDGVGPEPGQDISQDGQLPDSDPEGKPPRGHGRNGVDAFGGAQRLFIEFTGLKHGDPCLYCKGRVYRKDPAVVLRLFGSPPIQAHIWELDRLRCNLCGAVYKSEAPEPAQGPKYDESATAMIGMLKYGYGLPFNRLEKLQDCLQIPLPASTQWEKVKAGADKMHPAYSHLLSLGAQGQIIHNDDTPIKVLELMAQNADPENEGERKGMQTTGILSIAGDRQIALFFTGRNHAGENFAQLMTQRESDRPPPIQMCDAKSDNFSKYRNVILANCNSHARRKFVYEVDTYPDQCEYVLGVFETLYKNDAYTKTHQLTDQQRLEYHQQHSGQLMESFHKWLNDQFEHKLVEPNSGMGQAISYTLNHWPALTRFLHVPGVPLDNNLCEQMLKRAILHRKNSLFYKTMNGAEIGDMYMSLIHTCVYNDVNPFDYLIALQRHSSEVFKHPEQWMPWNYLKTITRNSTSSA